MDIWFVGGKLTRKGQKMTHDRIKLRRRMVRYNVALYITDAHGRHVKLDAAVETVNYGTGTTLACVDAEGIFFTLVVPSDSWNRDFYTSIQREAAKQYRNDVNIYEHTRSGSPVIPEHELSTGCKDG